MKVLSGKDFSLEFKLHFMKSFLATIGGPLFLPVACQQTIWVHFSSVQFLDFSFSLFWFSPWSQRWQAAKENSSLSISLESSHDFSLKIFEALNMFAIFPWFVEP
jgi:hypothetical protein